MLNFLEQPTRTPVIYLSDKEHFSLFFPRKLLEVVNELNEIIGSRIEITIFPDADIKSNGLPTGIACMAPAEDMILLPPVLRDPGCGYLTYKVQFTELMAANWHQTAGKILTAIVDGNARDSIRKRYLQSKEDLRAILLQGLSAIPLDQTEIKKFSYLNYPVNSALFQPSEEEIEALYADFGTVTNSIEIRGLHKIFSPELLSKHSVDSKDYIGFIHAGCNEFPNILIERFVYAICEYADQNQLFTLDNIKKGYYGVSYQSELGQQYTNWLHAAMNYALVNRYCIYQALKTALEAELPCKLTVIRDNSHAGIFYKTINQKRMVSSVRGVQTIFTASQANSPHEITLLAGQRETVAALVTGGSKASVFNNRISHGTGYQESSDIEYNKLISENEEINYLELAKNAFYNTEPKFNKCIPYTYNLLSMLNYFSEIELAEPVALLNPLINVQGCDLKKLDDCEKIKT